MLQTAFPFAVVPASRLAALTRFMKQKRAGFIVEGNSLGEFGDAGRPNIRVAGARYFTDGSPTCHPLPAEEMTEERNAETQEGELAGR